MKEVLQLKYDAAADSIVARVSVVKESEHVPGAFVRQLGAPEPEANVAIDDLPEEHREAFRALLAALIPIVEGTHAALVSDPRALAEAAAEIAREKQQLAARTSAVKQVETEISARLAEIGAPAKE